MRNFVLLVLFISIILLSALSVNQEEIVLKFAVWETPFKISVYWWLLAALALGFSLGLLNTFFINIRLRLENKRLKKALEQSSVESD